MYMYTYTYIHKTHMFINICAHKHIQTHTHMHSNVYCGTWLCHIVKILLYSVFTHDLYTHTRHSDMPTLAPHTAASTHKTWMHTFIHGSHEFDMHYIDGIHVLVYTCMCYVTQEKTNVAHVYIHNHLCIQ